jgi:hypothetical protein
MGLVAKQPESSQRQQTGGEPENPRPEHATGTVHHDAVLPDGTVVHHHQSFDRGLLTEWERDSEPGPWALVRPGDPFVAFDAGPVEPKVAAGVKVRIGDDLLDLPALDDLSEPGWEQLSPVPDATVRLRFELSDSPVGLQLLDTRYQDGRRTARFVTEWSPTVEGEPAHDAPDLHVQMTWGNYLRMRSGELTALEAIEDRGSVDGRWTLLLLLHGLVQQEESMAISRSLPRMPEELTWWGEIARWIPARDSF